MILHWLGRRRQILKYFLLLFTVYIIVRVFSKSEAPGEETELPILVAQRGNDRYFTANIGLNSQSYSRQILQWEKEKQAISSQQRVTFGRLNVHIWGEICGDDLKSLKNHVLFPKFPSRRFYTKTTRFTHGIGNYDYGERIFGFILTKSTGIHSFRVNGKSVEVWIGENAYPSSGKQVYKLSNSQDSIGKFELNLVASNKYYIEILHKKGKEDGIFDLMWKTPGSSNFAELTSDDISLRFFDDHLRNGEVDSNERDLEIQSIHRKDQFPVLSDKEQDRNDLFILPLIKSTDLENILPSCEYKPSYIVDHPLSNYRGVWETHYNSLYPVDKTNVTRGGWVCLGNDALDKSDADQIVEDYMKSLNRKVMGSSGSTLVDCSQLKRKLSEKFCSIEKLHPVERFEKQCSSAEKIGMLSKRMSSLINNIKEAFLDQKSHRNCNLVASEKT